MKATAAVLEKLGSPLALREIEIPNLRNGQVLVKILYSGVCRSQLMEVRGGRGLDPWVPHLLGHEGSGVVLRTGPNVLKVNPGDEVILGWIRGVGIDAAGAVYKSRGQLINSGAVSTFSNYAVVSENRVVKKPAGLAFDSAVLFGCALPTGAGIVVNELKPTRDQTVAVIGLGGIGMAALMALKALKVLTVIAIDTSEEKLRLARDLGAGHTLNPQRSDFDKRFREVARGGVDFCVESAGSSRTIELGFSLIKKWGGRLIFASHPPDGEMISLTPHDLISGKQISGSWGGATRPDQDIPYLFEVMRESPFAALLAKRYSLDQVNEALGDLERGRVFRPLLVMDH